MAMKGSARRTILRRVQLLLNQLITMNEEASRLETRLTDAGVSDVADTVQKALDAAGPVGTDDTLSKEIVNILDGTVPAVGAIDWTYEAE